MLKGFQTVWLLALLNAVAMSGSPMIMLIGSIIGTRLAPTPGLATLPITLMIVGTALGVFPATRGMARFGRKRTLALFLVLGVGAMLLNALALERDDFALFCLGASLIGATNAALQQVRFAAMERLPLDRGPTVASIIMCAGIVAAFLGPELAVLGKNLLSAEYLGSFLLGTGCYIFAGFLLLFYSDYRPGQVSEVAPARPLRVMLRERSLVLAIASGAVAFIIMSFVMTATPISMHVHHGHSLEDTKWVIQWHIAAMFLPSLVTAWLFKALSIRGLMVAGLACYGTTIAIGLVDVTVLGFWGQLVMLGIGWNFLFVAGTALLPTTYREGEQYRAQAANDTVVFSTQAVASLCAGWALSLISWQALLLSCLAPMGLMAFLLLWHRRPI